jgi:hypothetical protein
MPLLPNFNLEFSLTELVQERPIARHRVIQLGVD